MTTIDIDTIINHPNFDRQVQLEEEMRGMGIERFRTNLEKNKEHRQETKGRSVQRLVSHAHDKMVEAIEGFIAESNSGKAGRKHVALKFIKMADDVEMVAHLTIRSLLDGVSQRASLAAAASAISGLIEDEINSRRFKAAMPAAYKKFHERAKEENLARRRRSHLLFPAQLLGVELEEWSHRDRVLLGTKLIELFVQATGLVQMHMVPSEKGTVYVVEATEETLKWIEEENRRIEWMAPVYMPTVIPPKPWTDVSGGGYWTRHIRSLRLVKTHNPSYLEELSGREMPEVYGAVNALQETAWRINERVLDVMEHFWNSGADVGDLPCAMDMPMPPKPVWMMGERRVPKEEMTPEMETELREWKARAADIHAFNGRMKGRRLHLLRMLWVAKKFRAEEEIYFPHQLDWRGRAYPVPLYLHPQGNDLQRGLLTFANAVPITDVEDARWLAIHGAGLWGVDKVSMAERAQWIEDHSDQIIACANDPYENRFWLDADKPWSALAFCFEWADFQREGFGFMSSLPIQMDGTCNGLQNFSAMLLDEVGGAAVNLVPGEKPSDIYQIVADVVNRRIAKDVAEGNELAIAWLGHVTRKVTKRPVMTLAYGARQYGFVKQIEEDTVKPWRQESASTYPFIKSGEDGQLKDFGGDACLYLGKLIWESVGEVVIAARAAMDWLQTAARVAAKDGLPVMWTTPTGFLVMQAYRVPAVKMLDTTFEKVRIQPTYQVGEGKIDSRRQASGISPNWVHSLDASHLMKTINRAYKEGIRSFSMIHDSYGTHAGNAWALARFLREEFVQMYAQVDVLARFKADLEAQVNDPTAIPELPPKGNLDLNLVLESEFFFA
jgi:DNA-directed RNA polymerase